MNRARNVFRTVAIAALVASDPEFVETYDFAGNGFWSTPVQPNLDACVGS